MVISARERPPSVVVPCAECNCLPSPASSTTSKGASFSSSAVISNRYCCPASSCHVYVFEANCPACPLFGPAVGVQPYFGLSGLSVSPLQKPATATDRPSGEKPTHTTVPRCLGRLPTCHPDARSHTVTVPLSLPVAITFPSGLNAAASAMPRPAQKLR